MEEVTTVDLLTAVTSVAVVVGVAGGGGARSWILSASVWIVSREMVFMQTLRSAIEKILKIKHHKKNTIEGLLFTRK